MCIAPRLDATRAVIQPTGIKPQSLTRHQLPILVTECLLMGIETYILPEYHPLATVDLPGIQLQITPGDQASGFTAVGVGQLFTLSIQG